MRVLASGSFPFTAGRVVAVALLGLALGACDAKPKKAKPTAKSAKATPAPRKPAAARPAPAPVAVSFPVSRAAAPPPVAAPKPPPPTPADYAAASQFMSLEEVSFLLRGGQSPPSVIAEIKQRRLVQAGLAHADLVLSGAGVTPGEALLAALRDPANLATPAEEAAYAQLMQQKPAAKAPPPVIPAAKAPPAPPRRK